MRSVGGWRSVLTAAMALVSVAGAASTGREQPAPTGSVTGRVTLVARVRGAAIRTNAYSPRVVGRLDPPSVPEVQNVVAYLKDITYAGPLPVMRRQILQEHESFVPRVVAITRGSFIEFPNFDPFFHNVFSRADGAVACCGDSSVSPISRALQHRQRCGPGPVSRAGWRRPAGRQRRHQHRRPPRRRLGGLRAALVLQVVLGRRLEHGGLSGRAAVSTRRAGGAANRCGLHRVADWSGDAGDACHRKPDDPSASELLRAPDAL